MTQKGTMMKLSTNHNLKLIVSKEWTDGKTDFLHGDTDSQKLRADQKNFGWALSKMDFVCLVMGLKNWLYLKNEQID